MPWCSTGFTFDPGRSLGGHPAHQAGLFYLQEPSAMAVAEAVGPAPGSRTIDLAAAPGGKTTHLSALVGDDGLVVANEVSRSRLRSLHDNLEQWGAANVVTLSAPVDELAAAGPSFDAAVLDAPCSGEALFRRDRRAVEQWSPRAVDGAARRQDRLLTEAAALVGPGGRLVYSTCAFGSIENEERIASFLDRSDGWRLDDCRTELGASPGRDLASVARFWPHRQRAEGQFVARLERDGIPDRSRRRPGGDRSAIRADTAEARAAAVRFLEGATPARPVPVDRLVVRGDRVYLAPSHPLPAGLSTPVRPGLPIGRLRPGRFQPHPGLATTLGTDAGGPTVSWDLGDERLATYLGGEEVSDPGPDGWVLVCLRRWGIGWARRRSGTLKNAFPRHLRRQAVAWQLRCGRPAPRRR